MSDLVREVKGLRASTPQTKTGRIPFIPPKRPHKKKAANWVSNLTKANSFVTYGKIANLRLRERAHTDRSNIVWMVGG